MSVHRARESFTASVGKIRRKAYRLHETLSNSHDSVRNLEDLPKPFIAQQGNVPFSSVKTENIFKNVYIPPEALKQKLPIYSKKDEKNFGVKSAIALNCNGEITEIKKMRRRKIPFHELVASANDFLKKREAAKEKEKADILNDLQALQAALPTVEENGEKKANKPRASKSFAQQNAEMMEDIQAYHQCLARPDFETDPFKAVTSILTQHILKS